ncbi:MAG: phenylalanine--tRNA ligase subunit beta, partial [Flavobacteriales bacterium]
MRISWNWLKQYIDTDISVQKAAEILTSTGLEVESVEVHEPIKGMLRGVVVGHVLECAKHPDADRLSVCKVDLGTDDPVQIVCGAPNVAAGQKVLVATVGADLCMKDGTCIIIKKSKIRGQESNGMICAEDELGLGQSHDGILVLPATAKIGTPAVDQMGLKSDHFLEIGLTPNRTDAMGHIGVARDLVAAMVYRSGADVSVKWPNVDGFGKDGDGKAVEVTVEDSNACPRYAGVTLADVKVAPSPEWLQNALKSIGLKPINNVVDVTNYVQHELGQPLHAFDAEKLKDGKIIVRRATENEAFTTLDEKVRKLNEQDLVIADGSSPACIAGVFGGALSGVTDITRSIFLESAYFEPTTIRRTARRHGLSTDASFRFERGVDPEITVYALKRAALLLKEVAGASVISEITDIDQRQQADRTVYLKFAYCDALTGIRIPHEDILDLLRLLDFKILEQKDDGVVVSVPSYRNDVMRPADVVEEILRIHGFDQVLVPERLLCPPVLHDALTLESLRERTGQHMAARGFREIMTPSLTNGERAQNATAGGLKELVSMANPLSAELDVLRPTLLHGALQAVGYNINRQQRDLRFFERGRVYVQSEKGIIETESMSVVLTGKRFRERWRSVDRKVDLADVKEEVEALLERMGLMGIAAWEPIDNSLLSNAYVLNLNGRQAGFLGEIAKAQLKVFDISQPVFYAELAEEVILKVCKKQQIGFSELSKFPVVRRDL